MKKTIRLVGRSLVLVAGCVLVGVVFNALRPDGIDLIARAPYEIFTPCPESQVDAGTVSVEEVATKQVVYLDARPADEYAAEHIKGAISFPYPVLGDPPPEKVRTLKTRGAAIVTYGEGGRDRTGEMMADLLTELGVEKVTHLEGGLEAWREQGRPITKAGGTSDE